MFFLWVCRTLLYGYEYYGYEYWTNDGKMYEVEKKTKTITVWESVW